MLLREFAVRQGSGGAGRWQGGDGAVRRLRVHRADDGSALSGHLGRFGPTAWPAAPPEAGTQPSGTRRQQHRRVGGAAQRVSGRHAGDQRPPAVDTGVVPAPDAGGSARDTLTLCDRDAAAGDSCRSPGCSSPPGCSRAVHRPNPRRALCDAAVTITHLFRSDRHQKRATQARGQRQLPSRTTCSRSM